MTNKELEQRIIAFLIVAWLFGIFLFILFIKTANSSPDANVPTSSSMAIFSEDGELIRYTETNSWGVKTTATVLKSSCRVCLDNNYIDDCWDIGECLTVNKD